MELSLQQRRKALLSKIPDIEQTLSVVSYLHLRRRKAVGEKVDEEKDEDDELDDLGAEEGKEDGPLKTLFELNDTLYAEAEIQETGEVGLWLGVSVFLVVTCWHTKVYRRILCCCIPQRKPSTYLQVN